MRTSSIDKKPIDPEEEKVIRDENELFVEKNDDFGGRNNLLAYHPKFFLACDECRNTRLPCMPLEDGEPCERCLAKNLRCNWDRRQVGAGETDTDISDLEESGKGERIRQWQADQQMAAMTPETAKAIYEQLALLGAEIRASPQASADTLGPARVGMASDEERAYAARIARQVVIKGIKRPRGESFPDRKA